MAGWLSLELADGTKIDVESVGETAIDIAKPGYPRRIPFSKDGLVTVKWRDEQGGPKVLEAPSELELELALNNEEGAV